MHYVGVDLAWGDRNPTGVAVLDDAGQLLHVTTVRTDDEIVEAVSAYTQDACLVSIDAPLIVINPTGNRPAEAALNKDFSRFDAGAHPSNAGKPEFADKPRGARIAGRLGLDLNPRSRRPRRAIEVYPHPATIALFRLGRTLKYKHKPGRDLDQLRAELLALMTAVEGLTRADPPLLLEGAGARAWQALREEVEQADRKSRLRVVEDQVDAVLCAYVARFATARPEDTTQYGDLETGYIITPTLPADLAPTPRTRKAGTSATPEPKPELTAVQQYEADFADLQQATQGYVALVTSILDEAGIDYLSVAGRTKSVASFEAKAARRGADDRPVFADPLGEIGDQIGIRVITFVRGDVQRVAGLLKAQVEVYDDRDLGEETASLGRFGYASRHLQIRLDHERAGDPACRAMAGRPAQVQIRTVLQHAWAEFEHDIRYKGSVPAEHASDFDRRFTLAAGLLELADQEFTTIRDRLRGPVGSGPDGPAITPRELAAFLAGQYDDADWSRTEHYTWICELVADLGIESLAGLAEQLRAVDDELLARRMDYRYPPGAVRRLDDALLWAFGETYAELPGNAHRVEALVTRLARMRGSES